MRKIINIMLLYLCAFSFCCLTAIGDELLIDDLDPASILDDDSSQNETILIPPVSTNLFDIQALSKTGLADFNNTLASVAPATNFVAEVNNEQLHSNQSIPTTNNDPNTQNIVTSSVLRPASSVISPPHSVFRPPVSDEQDDLKQIIEQIRSIHTGQEKPAQKAVEPAENIDEPNEIIKDETPLVPQPALEIKTESAGPSLLSSQILQQVDNLIKEPNRISNPLELAEILFKSGKTAQAAVCYKQALLKTSADDVNMASQRAWILFQIGNCLKFDDPNTAGESFSQLLSAYPDSPWASAAKTSRDLADWLRQDQPQKLISDLKK